MLNIGLLLDSLPSDRYAQELVRWAAEQADLRISHLILLPRRREPLSGLAARTVFGILLRLERMLLPAHLEHRASRPLTAPAIVLRDESDVEQVRSLGLDLLVSCTPRTPPGALRGASRLGVIGFVHDGFWECYEQRPQTSFVIQRLTERGSEVLVRGGFRTLFYYSLNRANVRAKALSHLKRLLKRVAERGELPAARPAELPARTGHPSLAQCVSYGGKLAKRIGLKAAGRLLAPERFSISVLPGKWDEKRSWQVNGAAPRRRYWADPFLCMRDGRTYCFVEDLDPATGRAHISVLELLGTRIVERGIALREPFHLSFPFLFEYGGELYMCPESSAARQIRVYRCIDFPLQWRLEKTLMDGVSAADVLLFEKAGRWWLLANIDEAGTGDHNSELHLFSAGSPLSTAWVAHPQNPILIDSIGGRNGGLIREGARLFRLGQCQGFDRYGESLRVYQIKEVSATRYAEELVAELRPQRSGAVRGMHHLSTDGKTTVVDYASGSFAS